MTQPQLPLNEDQPLALSDLVRLVKKGRKIIWCLALLSAATAIFVGLTRPIAYQAEATFREKGPRGGSIGGSGGMMSAVLSSFGSVGGDQELVSLLKSRQLMTPVIETLGLQAHIIEPTTQSSLTILKNNLKLTICTLLGDPHACLKEWTPLIAAKNVHYSGEQDIHYGIVFENSDQFRVEQTGQLMGIGHVGQPFQSSTDLTFTLIQQKPGDLSGQTWSLSLTPLPKTALQLASQLKIKPAEVGEKVYKITFNHPDRHLASEFVNGLMASYSEFMQNENQRFSESQLSYLKTRQQESLKDLTTFMMDHANLLSQDLSTSGIIDTEKELSYLYLARQKHSNQLNEITLEFQRLQSSDAQDLCGYRSLCATPNLPPSIIEKISRISELTVQRDTLRAALQNQDLDQLRPANLNLQGMDLDTAKNLHLGLNTQLHDTHAEIRENGFILQQLQIPSFEISSVAISLKDPVGRALMTQASERVLNLKDDGNRSEREQTRIREQLEHQRAFLTAHLTQANELLTLREQLLKDKVVSLQRVLLELVGQEISVCQQHLMDYVLSRKSYLQAEQNLIEQSQGDLRQQMALLPTRWASEQIVMQRLKLNKCLVEEVAKLVESKNISNNLETVQSGPVDLAIPPLLPNHLNLMVFAVLGACFGTALGIGGVVLNGIRRGLAASPENLLLAKQYVAGSLSSQPNEQQETLRRLVAHLCSEDHGVALLMTNRGPDYSAALATLLAKRGGKVLRISLSFDTEENKKALPGLLQVLEGQATQPTILSRGDYDDISSGGPSAYRSELVSGRCFHTLLNGWMKQYDRILLVAPIQPDGGEAAELAQRFSTIAVTLNGERLQDLAPLFAVPHVAFIFVTLGA